MSVKVKKSLGRKRRDKLALLIFILVLFVLNYPYLDKEVTEFLDPSQSVFVNRVIDGDTIESNGTSIRLIGINTPERGEAFYSEAKNFLSLNVANKTVILEFIGPRYDKYDRALAYVHSNGENINVKMVENGFANYYFYAGKDKYSEDLLNAWSSCIEKNINLCEKSERVCGQCLIVENSRSVVNNCETICNITSWTVKGEGRDKFIFTDVILHPGEKENFALNFENTGGSIFLRDEKGKLVFWKGI